ncbi:unnamed protein product [Camellia sinensis]
MCRVQELDHDIALKNIFCLPLCGLSCSSLWVLRLNLICGNLKLPNVEFNSLQELSLIKFRVVNPLLGEWISSYCKAFTNLSLRVFYGMSNLNITSSSFQDMKITFHDEVCDVKISAAKLRTLFVGRQMGHGGGFRTGKSLIIFAPNLQEFMYVGDLVYISCKGEFKSLEIASVIVSDYPVVKAMIDSFIKFFCCLSKARKMELSDRFIKSKIRALLMRKSIKHAKTSTRQGNARALVRDQSKAKNPQNKTKQRGHELIIKETSAEGDFMSITTLKHNAPQ